MHKGAPASLLLASLWTDFQARRSKAGRYSVSVITLMEIALFGIALIVFVIGVLLLLFSR